MDAGRDAGARTCATQAECDDGVVCTREVCAVGGVCRYTPLDEMCAAGERCVVGAGCAPAMPTACTTSADCDDGVYCNGAEECAGPAGSRACVRRGPIDCDDGNACTTDERGAARAGCRYSTAPGCDAGAPRSDGGVPCPAFDPSAHYTGAHRVLPTVAAACGRAIWSINEVSFAVSGGMLEVSAGTFVLRGAVPAGGDFTASYVDAGCSRHTLTATFECADRFRGTWAVTFEGACAMCGTTTTTSVVGIRR